MQTSSFGFGRYLPERTRSLQVSNCALTMINYTDVNQKSQQKHYRYCVAISRKKRKNGKCSILNYEVICGTMILLNESKGKVMRDGKSIHKKLGNGKSQHKSTHGQAKVLNHDQLKNYIYIGITILLVSVMTVTTWQYLNHKAELKRSETVQVSSTNEELTDMSKEVTEATSEQASEPTGEVVENSESTEGSSTGETSGGVASATEAPAIREIPANSEPYMAEFRFLYTAAGGDDLETVSELTGVDVAVLAEVNSVPEDIVLVKDQRIYVP